MSPLRHRLRLSFFHCSSPRLCGEGFGKLYTGRLCVSSAGLSRRVVIMPVTAVQSLLDHLIILLAGAKPHVSPAPRMTPKAQTIDFNPTTPGCDHTAISFFPFLFIFSTVPSATTTRHTRQKPKTSLAVRLYLLDLTHAVVGLIARPTNCAHDKSFERKY